MIWVAEGWRRPARRTGLGLTILAACGLLAACSEAPKIGKAVDQEQRPVAQQSPPFPTVQPPEANAPSAPDSGSIFEHETNGGSGQKIPSVIGEGRIGAGAPSPSAEEPKESESAAAPPTEVEPKAVGAAPPPPPEPSEPSGGAAPPEPPAASAEAPAPKPRASYAQPAPSAAMPPPPPAPAPVLQPRLSRAILRRSSKSFRSFMEPIAPSSLIRPACNSDRSGVTNCSWGAR